MTPQRNGPGALAGAAEAGIECCREHPDTTFPAPRLRTPRPLVRKRQIERICHVPRLVVGPLDDDDQHHSWVSDLREMLARYAEFDSAVPGGGA